MSYRSLCSPRKLQHQAGAMQELLYSSSTSSSCLFPRPLFRLTTVWHCPSRGHTLPESSAEAFSPYSCNWLQQQKHCMESWERAAIVNEMIGQQKNKVRPPKGEVKQVGENLVNSNHRKSLKSPFHSCCLLVHTWAFTCPTVCKSISAYMGVTYTHYISSHLSFNWQVNFTVFYRQFSLIPQCVSKPLTWSAIKYRTLAY